MSEKLVTAAFGDKRNPKQLLIDALGGMDRAEMAVLVWKDDDGYVRTAWSDGDMTARVGLCDIAKLQMIEACKVGDE